MTSQLRREIEVELGYLRAGTERAGVLSAEEIELVSIAVRNVVWDRYMSNKLTRFREAAIDVLIHTASPELSARLRANRRSEGRLIRIPPTTATALPSVEGVWWVASRPEHPRLFGADRVGLGSVFITDWSGSHRSTPCCAVMSATPSRCCVASPSTIPGGRCRRWCSAC